MTSAANFLKSFVQARNGATAVEYALVAAGISLVIIVAVGSTGATLQTSIYSKVAEGLASL
ncbi:MAG TPA: Flp family type IVb pilin [Rhodobiaceae bacterium]|nr:Flp family type IVb pilin [Rhodobiaceae bacterium]